MIKLGPLAAIAIGSCLVLVALVPASADTKADMVGIIDKLSVNKPANEALVDWDNLVVKTPQTKNMDIHAMYSKMDAANKKAFRESFLKSFAQSFQQSGNGHKLSELAKKKGALDVVDKGAHPVLIMHQPHGKADLNILFTRKGKKLLFQGMETKG